MPSAPDPLVTQELARVLDAATAPASPAELAGEPAALAQFRTSGIGSAPRRPRRILASKAALAAVGAIGLLSAGGAAAAATGSLPTPAQDAAHRALTKVGVNVPRGKGLATAPGQVKKAAAADAPPKEPKPGPDKPHGPAVKPDVPNPKVDGGQGATISSIAHDPTLSGAEKGAAVSDAASDGKSHAGEDHGPPASSPSDTAPGKATASTAGPRGGPPVPPGTGGRP